MLREQESTEARPFSDQCIDAWCIAFAMWTVCSHVMVFLKGNLLSLIVLYGVACAAVLLFWWYRRSGRVSQSSDRASPSTDREELASRWPLGWRVVGALLGVSAVLLFPLHGSVLVLWWWIAGLLGAATVLSIRLDRPRVVSPAVGRHLEIGLWGLALLCVVVALVSHRYDPDDALYINFAVAAVDLPHWSLLSADSLHGIPDLPLNFPAYRVHSFELFCAAISYLTGIPAIYSFHIAAAAFGALLIPLCYAKLMRLLMPRQWLLGVGVVLLVILAVGEVHRWHGNFALVRMWHGKSYFLTIALPLVAAYAMSYTLKPSRGRLLLLAAAEITAVGCSSSAIWAAPSVAVMAMLATTTWNRGGLTRVMVGTTATIYVLAAGLVTRLAIRGLPHVPGGRQTVAPGVRLEQAFYDVLGDQRVLLFGLASLAIAWAVSSNGVMRRIALLPTLITWLVFLNPYLSDFVSNNFIGQSYWRALWVVPFPVLMAILLTAPMHGRWFERVRGGGLLVMIGSLLVFVLWVPEYGGLSKRNRVILKRPGLKIMERDYHWAQTVHETLPAGTTVLVPEGVGVWLPTFHRHLHPIKVRHYLIHLRARHYLLTEQGIASNNDFRHRDLMTRVTMGDIETGEALALFRSGLARFSVLGVFLQESPVAERARQILLERGYSLDWQDEEGGGELWRIDEPPVPMVVERGQIFAAGFEHDPVIGWSRFQSDGEVIVRELPLNEPPAPPSLLGRVRERLRLLLTARPPVEG